VGGNTGLQAPEEIRETHEGSNGGFIQPEVCYPPHWSDGGALMRHMDGLNILFADSHVKFVQWREMHQPRYCQLLEHP
jgi:prepilin-type processing-associated H-X9-DG protein